MVQIIQEPNTRKWGARVLEDLGHAIIQGGSTRILLEYFEFNSPAEVMPWIQTLQEAMRINRTRIRKEGIVWGYDIGIPGRGGILYSEDGWMNQNEVSEHLQLISVHCQGFPKIANPQKVISIRTNDKPASPIEDNEGWGKVDELSREDEDFRGAGWGDES